TNTGNQTATGVVINETVPANTTYREGGSTWSCADGAAAGSACRFTLPSLAPGRSATAIFLVRVNATVPAGVATIANTATVAADGANGTDPTPSNNSANATTPLVAQPDLRITKSDSGATVQPSGLITYTLSYTNTGTQAAMGVAITETVPLNTNF